MTINDISIPDITIFLNEMAKIGEGDPRWLVEEREDGKNVNSWHWEEKNITKWGHAKIKELFSGFHLFEDETVSISVEKVSSISGEVDCNVRKGKRIILFELNVTLRYISTSKTHPDTKPCFGKIKVIEIDPFSLDDFDFDVSKETSSEHSEQYAYGVKELVRKNCRARLSERFTDFMNEATKYVSAGASNQPKPTTDTSSKPKKVAIEKEWSKPSTSSTSRSSFTISLTLAADIATAYNLFVDSDMVRAYTQSDCQVSQYAGHSFSLFNGGIAGTNLDMDKNRRIVQNWRFANWPSDHFSRLTLEFKPDDHGTEIHIKHDDVPSDDLDRTKEGWKNQFFNRIRACMGYDVTFH